MAYGVRCHKTKTVVKAAALEMFCDEFAPEQMIRALIDMCEFAVTHPDFGKDGQPGAIEYDWADQATDALMTFFDDDCCCDESGAESPKVMLHYQRGTIEILKRRYRARRLEPSLDRATAPVLIRLASRIGAGN